MQKNSLSSNPKQETSRIVSFVRKTLKEQKFSKVVIGVSGGIDSTTALFLLAKSVPAENIYPVHLPYFQSHRNLVTKILDKLKIPRQNRFFISIQKPVDVFKSLLKISEANELGKIRLGNIMARIRMIILYDLAKKLKALVCGTENKSEHLLGYFTRFGDEASDFEPIQHLYKTQVYELAKYLKVPNEVISAEPTAGLWSGQTDEGQFGFTYQEADQVLHLYFEKKQPLEKIKKLGFRNASKIIDFSKSNLFKHRTPYVL